VVVGGSWALRSWPTCSPGELFASEDRHRPLAGELFVSEDRHATWKTILGLQLSAAWPINRL
jgi:hypothetical protein